MAEKSKEEKSRHSSLLFFFVLLVLPSLSTAKSTIEPCSGSDTCSSLLGYTLYADLKVSEVAALFQVDPLLLLSANSIDPSPPSAPNSILPSGLFLRVPLPCSCSDGIRRSLSVRYRTRPADTLSSLASNIFSSLASAEQIRDANGLSSADPDASLEVGQSLVIPLPCSCFNSTDNFLPAVYLSYVVREGDTVEGVAREYDTTVTDIMNVNAMGSPVIQPGDILAVPLPACTSSFPRYASDYGLIVANGSYATTAGHCVQCSCGPGNLNLYCTPASLSVSCSSMQCSNSNLMLGNITSQPTTAGCKVTSCTYGGYVNGTITTTLSTSLQPQCPGVHQFPKLITPPTQVTHDSFFVPSPSPLPSQPGGPVTAPKTSAPGSFALPGVSPANGPAGSISAATYFVNPLNHLVVVCILHLFLEFLM
ncbi:putative lysM domain-containing GPI-anchored protein 1 isoform X1 [Iris pallida]|uniref:LysM domain-containing GPI-anchored protein 1 isoform X1 n=1 Tax=Iris pallida TaxID=29817 RepID=A0AAX6I125_IRIPA|nr:putative lysM domain-containing GPI-anchored protein 1 isoform X1 [Iris pallida]